MPTTQQLLTRWFLTSTERGNTSTRLDGRHLGGAAWTEGNMVRPLIHGSTYFAELHRRVSQMRDGDLLMFVDWRGHPDERLTGPRTRRSERCSRLLLGEASTCPGSSSAPTGTAWLSPRL